MLISTALPMPVGARLRLPSPTLAPTRPSLAATRPIQRVIGGAFDSSLRSFQALPSFLYPAISGTAAEKAMIMQTLDQLPLHDVGSVCDIRMVDQLQHGDLLGVTRPSIGHIDLGRLGHDYGHPGVVDPDLLRPTVIHEVGHAHDANGGIFHLLSTHSSHAPWGKPPFVSSYASTMPAEDYAESHAVYHMTPEQARAAGYSPLSPEKFKAMQASEQPNFMERLVDHHAFRDTGRYIGELTSACPWVRPALAFVSSVVILNMVTAGAMEAGSGLKRRNKMAVTRGALTMGAGLGLGLAFANPVLGPAALALMGARRGLDTADRRTAGAVPTRRYVAAATGGAIGGVVGGIAAPLLGTVAGYSVGGPVGGAIGLVASSLIGYRGGSYLGARAALAVVR